MMQRRHGHYLDGTEPDPEDFLLQVQVPSAPESATRGDILVTVLEAGVDEWVGVWRLETDEWDGQRRGRTRLGSLRGTRAELVRWAVAQDAATRWIFDEEASTFIPLV